MTAIATLLGEHNVQSIEINYGKNIYCRITQEVRKSEGILFFKITNYRFSRRCKGKVTYLHYLPDISKLYFASEYYTFIDHNHFKNWALEDFQNFDEFHHLYSIKDNLVQDYLGNPINTPVVLGDTTCSCYLGLVGSSQDVTKMLVKHNIPIIPFPEDNNDFTNHIEFPGICASLVYIPGYRDYDKADHTAHITLKPPSEYLRHSKKEGFDILKDLYPDFVKECQEWEKSLKSNPDYEEEDYRE